MSWNLEELFTYVFICVMKTLSSRDSRNRFIWTEDRRLQISPLTRGIFSGVGKAGNFTGDVNYSNLNIANIWIRSITKYLYALFLCSIKSNPTIPAQTEAVVGVFDVPFRIRSFSRSWIELEAFLTIFERCKVMFEVKNIAWRERFCERYAYNFYRH